MLPFIPIVRFYFNLQVPKCANIIGYINCITYQNQITKGFRLQPKFVVLNATIKKNLH